MSMIIHSVGDLGDVRILFEGDEPLNDDIFEVPLKNLRSKAYLVNTLREQYPDLLKALFPRSSNAYGK